MQRVSPEQMEVYRQTARRRQAEREVAARARLQLACGIARQAADWLKETYAVEAVWLFGSLADNFEFCSSAKSDLDCKRQAFTLTSDIDLAVEQLSPDDYLTAIALLQDISSEFKIDLVQLESIPSSFKSAILDAGKLL